MPFVKCSVDGCNTKLQESMAQGKISPSRGINEFVIGHTCTILIMNGETCPVVDERSELHPGSLYAEKKAEAERALFSLSAPGMTVTALRMATLYGLSPRMRFDLAINLMVMNAATRRAIFAWA